MADQKTRPSAAAIEALFNIIDRLITRAEQRQVHQLLIVTELPDGSVMEEYFACSEGTHWKDFADHVRGIPDRMVAGAESVIGAPPTGTPTH